MYILQISDQAKKDIVFLKRTGGKTIINKIERLLRELMEHPKTGIGRVEQLKGHQGKLWSRRIDNKHRIVYTINDEIMTVTVIAARGHYGEK